MSGLESSMESCSVQSAGSHVPNGVENGEAKGAGRSAN